MDGSLVLWGIVERISLGTFKLQEMDLTLMYKNLIMDQCTIF